MKLNKKKVFLAALAICVVAILSVGTLAWFQANDEVKNTFKVTTSDEDGTPDFSVDLFEHEVDPDTGKEKTNAQEVEENTYNNLQPGDVLDKDPTVRNTGNYDQWIRVKVTLSDYSVWCNAMGVQNWDFATMLDIDATKWTYVATVVDATADTVTYTYLLNDPLLVDGEATLFNTVTLPGEELTVDNFKFAASSTGAGDQGVFALDIVAEAVQRENIADTCLEAWAVIDAL